MEALDGLRALEAGAHQLEGDPLLEFGLALGEIDRAHATLVEQTLEAVGTDEPPFLDGIVLRGEGVDQGLGGRRGFQGLQIALVGEVGFDLVAQLRIALAGLVEPGASFLGVDVDAGIEQLLDPLPALGGHGVTRPPELVQQPQPGGAPFALDGHGGDLEAGRVSFRVSPPK